MTATLSRRGFLLPAVHGAIAGPACVPSSRNILHTTPWLTHIARPI